MIKKELGEDFEDKDETGEIAILRKILKEMKNE